ncbi:MAG: pyridoxal-dependent decarboxylase [Anaerolineales bacterium]|jgi:glutamate/tyrosine decarboxylase-like PLP-dependent enzyme
MSTWRLLENEIEQYRHQIHFLPIQPVALPSQLRAELNERYPFSSPIPLEEVVEDVTRLLREYTVHVTHPRYFGLFNPSVRYASILADTIVALYNPQLAAWSHAPGANEIERHTLRHFARLLGWDPDIAMMNFTSGGMEANLSAVLAAVSHHFPESGKNGIASLTKRPIIFITRESHHSFVKIVRMTGLGTDCLHEVPTSEDHIMDISALEELIKSYKKRQYHPLMVVGTAGTTGAGLIDPLPQMAAIAERQDLWFHVDAAWGGSALLSPRLRKLLTGIEHADSVTWDAHKWLSVPMGAGMFFCRHITPVINAFAVTTSYMPDKVSGDTYDPYTTTAQWSRRMIGLKVFMAFAESGSEGYAVIIDRQADIGNYLRQMLQEENWIVVNNTQLPVVCFTHADIRSGKMTTSQILQIIYERNRVWISDYQLGGTEFVLRACITSFNSDEGDIQCLIDELNYAHQRLAG